MCLRIQENKSGDKVGEVKEALNDIKDQVGDSVKTVLQNAKDSIDSKDGEIKKVLDEVKDKAGQLKEKLE